MLLEMNDEVEGCVRLHQAGGGGLGDDFRLVTFSGIHISKGRREEEASVVVVVVVVVGV